VDSCFNNSSLDKARFNKVRALFLLALIPFSLLVLASLIKKLPGDKTGRDFRQLYAAGYMVRAGIGSQLYNMEIQNSVEHKLVPGGYGGYIPFIRPAYEAILFEPFSFLPYRTAYIFFLALNILLLATTVVMLSPRSGWGLLRVAGIAVSFLPVSIALFQGQDSILLTLLLAVSSLALDRDRPLLAGVFAGLGLFKFQLTIPIFLLFLAWRRWRFCCGFVVSALGAALVSIWLTGFPQVSEYLYLLHGVDSNKTLKVSVMGNLHGLIVGTTLGTMGSIPEKTLIAIHLALGMLLALFLPRLKGRNALLLAIPAAALCSYYLFNHDLTVLLLPMIAVMTAPHAPNLLWFSALLLLLAPALLTAHLYLVALPLSFFLLELALTGRRSRDVALRL
jgi:hypothetical protein